MEFVIGRNAPCPCNSGEKYKSCCLGSLTIEQERYYGLLHREELIKGKLVNIIFGMLGDEKLDEYVYRFNKKNFRDLSPLEITTFFDWFFLECEESDNKTFLQLIAENYSNLFDDVELKIIQEWIGNTRAGVFEVLEPKEEKWNILLKDIITNKEYLVRERIGSANLVKGDIIFARTQKIFSDYYLGGTLITYGRSNLPEIKEFLISAFEKEKKNRPNLDYEDFIKNNGILLADFKPADKKFYNMNDEEVMFCEASYILDTEVISEILNFFDRTNGFKVLNAKYKSNKLVNAEIGLISKNKGCFGSGKKGISISCQYIDEFGEKLNVICSISIKGKKLKVFSESKRSFEKTVKLLEKRFSQYLTIKDKTIKTTEQVSEETEEPEDEEDSESTLELENQLLKDHYLKWCHSKIPAFDDLTPKQMIRTEKGRNRLRESLLDLENFDRHREKEGKGYINLIKIIKDELGFHE